MPNKPDVEGGGKHLIPVRQAKDQRKEVRDGRTFFESSLSSWLSFSSPLGERLGPGPLSGSPMARKPGTAGCQDEAAASAPMGVSDFPKGFIRGGFFSLSFRPCVCGCVVNVCACPGTEPRGTRVIVEIVAFAFAPPCMVLQIVVRG